LLFQILCLTKGCEIDSTTHKFVKIEVVSN
jgi:hypothetical protein